MLDEQTIERIVEKVLQRLLIELSDNGQHPPRLTQQEAARARASLTSSFSRGDCEGYAGPAPVLPPAPRMAPQVAQPHAGRLLSEDELVCYYRRGIRVIQLEARCLVTPAARDRARDLQVDLLEG